MSLHVETLAGAAIMAERRTGTAQALLGNLLLTGLLPRLFGYSCRHPSR